MAQIIQIKQGTDEWLRLRQRFFTASDAAAVVGSNPYKSADAVIGEKLGIYHARDNAYLSSRKALGHQAEKSAKLLAEIIIGEDLLPLVMTNQIHGMPFLASFDGITQDYKTGWEHKLLNQKYVKIIEETKAPPEIHIWQLEHQMLTSGCEVVLYMLSDIRGNVLINEDEQVKTLWYRSDPERREELIEAWRKIYDILTKWGWQNGS